MFDSLFSILGMIGSSIFLIWCLAIFVPDIIDYIKENKKYLFATVIIAIILNFLSAEVVEITALVLMAVPLCVGLCLIIGAVLEILKSPYSEFFGGIYSKYEGTMKAFLFWFVIGCIIYFIVKAII